jgi:hypothetical protein
MEMITMRIPNEAVIELVTRRLFSPRNCLDTLVRHCANLLYLGLGVF